MHEAKGLLADVLGLELLTFLEVPFSDVDETGTTFYENAILKATSIGRETGLPVLSEDAGLEVAALNGAPGVYSARFAGQPSDASRNNALLLQKLEGVDERTAQFVTVACLYLPDGRLFMTSGTYAGTIARVPRGGGGFGYDPLFVPEGEHRTLGEMSSEEKNRASHRAKALSRMRLILSDLLRSGDL